MATDVRLKESLPEITDRIIETYEECGAIHHLGHSPLPSYREVSRSGPDHAPLFVVEAIVEGYAPERGVGSSLREAEKTAALALLEREGAT